MSKFSKASFFFRYLPLLLAVVLLVAGTLIYSILTSSKQVTAVVVENQPITLDGRLAKLATLKVDIDPQAESFTVRLRRPTTASPLAWDEGGILKINIILEVDGVEYRATGQTSGGIRINSGTGEEFTHYTLIYTPTWGFFGSREGFPRRLGETKQSTYTARLELELLAGSVSTNVEMTYDILAAPRVEFHSSAAFNSSTSAQDSTGDGVISVSVDAGTGSNRAAYMGVINTGESPPDTTGTATYDSVSMTELYDVAVPNISHMAAYVLAGIDTGSSDAISDLDGGTETHAMWVMTMTGVDQTTPAGTPATATGSGTTASATATGVASDDLVVDTVLLEGATGTVGADQLERETEATGFPWMGGSTQLGSAGGVMTWTGFDADWGTGAVAIKASTEEPPPPASTDPHVKARGGSGGGEVEVRGGSGGGEVKFR